ncbi:hypothetical protein BC792_11634 [Sphingobacterium allocomposti]|uniref:Uncharacterized protein n=1 Tax=Sphingobacterium allocomposti TaxID=415956 RepID=A0A5S5DCL2_9SPHI|nr:hypothetical protein [Sphingobacterium composti Yoo et al. 2007 non Ten et al. 2007]TYP92432.1 hypothetical protein BC792_11634 [Sphingobacterium composti Yoo et al. 2007 non Ten et al. 2007]
MRREELIPYGEELSSRQSADGSRSAVYTLVAYADNVVGVGLFYQNEGECALAIISESVNDRTMLGKVSDSSPIDSTDVQELQRLFNLYFPPSGTRVRQFTGNP